MDDVVTSLSDLDPDPLAPLGSFLLPDGFARPGLPALLHEARLPVEAARHAVRAVRPRRGGRRPYAGGAPERAAEPVLLIPGFLAGDRTLSFMARELRARGWRTYRSHIASNVGCTYEAATRLESRLEAIVARRGSRVQVVGHSLGGMMARGIAVRRPDLVAGIVTMGSPMLAPGAHHVALSAGVGALVRLSAAGVPGLMAADCVAGACARASFEDCRRPMPDGVGFTALWSRRDGVVDWRACRDPEAVDVEVTSSHCGMAVDPAVLEQVVAALGRQRETAAVPRLRIA